MDKFSYVNIAVTIASSPDAQTPDGHFNIAEIDGDESYESMHTVFGKIDEGLNQLLKDGIRIGDKSYSVLLLFTSDWKFSGSLLASFVFDILLSYLLK